MNLDRAGFGRNVPDVFNVIIEILMDADPVKYEVDKETGAHFRRPVHVNGDTLPVQLHSQSAAISSSTIAAPRPAGTPNRSSGDTLSPAMISTGTSVASSTRLVVESSSMRVSEFLRAVLMTMRSQRKRRAACAISAALSPTSRCSA